jgi:hypothetical protein
MKFLLAIYHDETRWPALDEAAQRTEIDEYWRLDDEATAAGAFIASHALEPTATARSVRVRDGERLVTDGPFAETKEQLGGFYLLECRDVDEAIEWAGKVPAARSGRVDVRPVAEFGRSDEPVEAAGAEQRA